MWTLIPGVPIGCRSPRKWGPYSMPIHRQGADQFRAAKRRETSSLAHVPVAERARLLGEYRGEIHVVRHEIGGNVA